MSDNARPIRILHCHCKHLFQDTRYGKGRRVFNITGKSGTSYNTYRCTVCKAEKRI